MHYLLCTYKIIPMFITGTMLSSSTGDEAVPPAVGAETF